MFYILNSGVAHTGGRVGALRSGKGGFRKRKLIPPRNSPYPLLEKVSALRFPSREEIYLIK